MASLWVALASVCLAPVVGARLLPLAPGRLGWIPYLANIFSVTLVKRAGVSRPVTEMVAVLAAAACLGLAGVPWSWIVVVIGIVGGLELACGAAERRILTSPFATPGARGYGEGGADAATGRRWTTPGPTTHPILTINLHGPFRRRTPAYDLGTLVVGSRLELRVVVGNHSKVPTQTPVAVSATGAEGLELEMNPEKALPRLCPGDVREWVAVWRVQGSAREGALRIEVSWGESRNVLEIRFEAREAPKDATIRSAVIERYAGACRSAFAWRGDMDLYDETTLQSIEGLEVAFGLGERYRLAQTMYLSTRLSLDEEVAQEFGEHYGSDRGAARIPAFVAWLKANVEFRHSAAYPYSAEKRFVVELGNHGHLHFGTDTAAAKENGWRARARMGAGRYPWLGPEEGPLAEQRDNALEAGRLCESLLGFRPRSWAMPDRTNDGNTARAMEAAGCEVLSDSDVRTIHNVLLQPPPHHPPGTKAVELTKRFPGDPLDVFDVAMNVFWFHRAHRLGIPVIFMCHQHLRLYESEACPRFTEYLLRYALERFNGDLHVNTVYGIGKYWREVLSPLTRSVTVRAEDRQVVVENASDEDFDALPLDIELSDGTKITRLISVPARSDARVDVLA